MALVIKKTVSLSHTAEDWDLFTEEPGVDIAASALNRAFEDAVNTGKDRDTTRRLMGNVMGNYSQYGARDTEPERVLSRLLDKVFGNA